MAKRILLIGGNGFIGTNLSCLLVEKGYDVISFDLIKPIVCNENIKYICGDFFDLDTLDEITNNIDIVIHSLSTVNPGNSNVEYMRGYQKDFIQTINLIQIVISKGIKMIFLSSGGTVYGNQDIQPIIEETRPQPINHYGNIKLCIENTIRTFNTQLHTKIIIARISNPYGVGQDYVKGVGFLDAVLKKTLRNEIIEIWGDGTIERDYIYINDVSKMVESLICYNGEEEVFNISANRGTTQNQIIDIVRNLGESVQVKYLDSRSVDAKKIVLDNSKIKKVYKDELLTLEEGIEIYNNYLKNNYITL